MSPKVEVEILTSGQQHQQRIISLIGQELISNKLATFYDLFITLWQMGGIVNKPKNY